MYLIIKLAIKINFSILLVILCFFLSSCSAFRFAKIYASSDSKEGSLVGNVYKSKFTSYKIGTLSNDWKKIKVKDGDLLFLSDKRNSAITVNSTCEPAKFKFSLNALSNSLVIGVRDKQLLAREDIFVDSESALFSRYLSNSDNKEVNLATVVMKKSACVYDFSVSSTQNDFEPILDVFVRFISDFRVLDQG